MVWERSYDFWKSSVEIRIDVFNDKMKVLLDTSWDPLYKRGYKVANSKASLKETLAAGLCLLVDCKSDSLVDPFCWSGTILIEKALIDLNIAPGSFRHFLFEQFDWIEKSLIKKERWRASTRVKDKKLEFFWYDIDEKMVQIALENVKKAGLEDVIKIKQKNFLNLKISSRNILTNPPYGKRINTDLIDKIYEKLFVDLWNVQCWGIITGYKSLDKKWFDSFKIRILSNWGEMVKFFYKK